MPWLSIIMAIISALASLKQNPEKKGRAVALGALAGLGTYYVSHNTEWGQDTFGAIDGYEHTEAATGDEAADGSTMSSGTATASSGTGSNASSSGLARVLTDWGAYGTAAVIGTSTFALSDKAKQTLPWIVIGVVALLLIR